MPKCGKEALRFQPALSPSPLMSLPPAETVDRFHAAFLGLAIGDALGFPLRGIPPQSLARLDGLADDFAPRPRGRFLKGQFSDETQLLMASADSVARERKIDGRSIAAHLAWTWQEGIILQPSRALIDAVERLQQGTPWVSAGASMGVKDASALSRSLIAGLWLAETPARIPHEVNVLVIVTHKDPTCAAAGAAYARAVSLGLEPEPLTPQAFCETLAQAAATHDPDFAEELANLYRLLSWEPLRAIDQLRRVGVPPSMLRDEEGLPNHVVPVLLVALYAALKAPHDFRSALTLILQCGGEADVAAALCGGLLGAHLGTAALPPRLRRTVLYNDAVVASAQRLYEARVSSQSTSVAAPARVRR